MARFILFTEREYLKRLPRWRHPIHHLFRWLTWPRPMWPLWHAYRQRWSNPRLPRG